MSQPWAPDLNANKHGLQWDVFNSTARFLLVEGPRFSAKTWAVLHRIVRHMYDTPGASFAMFAPTIKNSKEGGTWQSLHRVTIPEWIGAGIGFNYTSFNNDGKPGWKVIGDTRTPYFSIRNRYGGESECRLFSLDHVPDVVDKVKSQEFSGIYFPELMAFDKEDSDRIVLSTTSACLRMPHLRYEDHLWIADTNPSPRGPDSWIYKTWFVEPKLSYDEYVAGCEAEGYEPLPQPDWRQSMAERQVITMIPEDNLRLDPRLLRQLKEQCRHDPGLYARDVMGKWIWGDGDQSRHFRSFFKPAIHVLGSIEFASEDDYEVIKPSRGSIDLVTGLDPGDANHAGVIIDRLYIGDRKHFNVLEELESVGKSGKMENFADRHGDWVSIEDFTIAFMGLIEDIESDSGREFNLEASYSDSSALEKYSAAGNTYTALEILAASKGRLTVIGVPKPNGSVRARINLVKKLLSQGRLHVSAQCVAVQRMLRDLKKGAGRLNFVVNDENKHIFDALSYPLIAECAEEIITQEDRMNVGKRQNTGTVIHL